MPIHQDSTKEQSPKFFNITFAILPSYQKKMFKLNGHPEYFGIYYSWWNYQIIQMCFKMAHFNIKTQNLELVILKWITYAQPIPLALNMSLTGLDSFEECLFHLIQYI